MQSGICPYCNGRLREQRVRREDNRPRRSGEPRDVPDALGPDILTTCPQCKRFIGRRPAIPKR